MVTDNEGSAADRVTRSIAEHQRKYLRDHFEVCAEGGTYGYSRLRHVDGEWHALQIGDREHRLPEYLTGRRFSEETALSWLINRPVTLKPVASSAEWLSTAPNVWAKAKRQDVFTDADRCFWCGDSENTADLSAHVTTEQGTQRFCVDCFETWDEQGEIDHSVAVTTEYTNAE